MTKKSTASRAMPVAVAYKPSAAEKKEQMRYRAEDAIRTLTRAEEIRKDPTLMKAVKTHAQEQVKTMQSVCKAAPKK